MSQSIVSGGNLSKESAGSTRSLLADAVVSTAISYLGKEFSKPSFELADIKPNDAPGINDVRNKYAHALEQSQTDLHGWNCRTPEEFSRKMRTCGSCPPKIKSRAYDAFDKAAGDRPLASLLAAVFKDMGLSKQAEAVLMNRKVDPCVLETLEVGFEKHPNRASGGFQLRNVNEDEGRLTVIAREGLTWNPKLGMPYLSGNVIARMVRDGFGELKDQVKIVWNDDDCAFFYKNHLISRGPDIAGQLELFRDAGVWIWLELMLRQHKAKRRERISWLKQLVGSKPEEGIEMASLISEGGFESFEVLETLMPEPSYALVPLIEALIDAGFAQDANHFVTGHFFVAAPATSGSRNQYALVEPSGAKAEDFRHVDSEKFWYFTLMEKLRCSNRFTFPELGL